MNKTLRISAPVLAAALLAMGGAGVVQAAAIDLDFEGLPTGSYEVTGPTAPVGSAYAAQGVVFSGSNTVVDGTNFLPAPPSGVQFLLSTSRFVIDVISPVATPFDILAFSYFGPVEIRIQDNAGNAPITALIDSLAGYDEWVALTPYQLDRTKYGLIESVTFIFNSTTGTSGFAIDNLALALQPGGNNPDPGGNVPEPATYGLAALALLGVGLASRRRRG